MKTKLFFLLNVIFLTLFITACNTKPQWEDGGEQNGLQTAILKDANGRLYGKKIFKNKARTNYTYLQFDAKGNLVDSITYLNNKRDGLRIFLLDNKVYYETYKQGNMSGLQQVLYANGVPEYVGYLNNGVKVGEWKFFYENSYPITYEFYDDKGKLLYMIRYEEDGKIKEKKGSEIMDLHVDKKVAKLSDTITVAALLAFPPNGENNVILLKDLGNEKVLEIPVKEPETFFQIVADKKGRTDYQIDYQWNIKDQTEINSSKATFTIEIN